METPVRSPKTCGYSKKALKAFGRNLNYLEGPWRPQKKTEAVGRGPQNL